VLAVTAAEPLGQQTIHRLANNLLGATGEYLLSGCIEKYDSLAFVHRNNCVHCGADYCGKPLLADAVGFLAPFRLVVLTYIFFVSAVHAYLVCRMKRVVMTNY
jgi:hypothetical protein